MQLKKNNSLAKQLEETLSSRDMLTLKFQQVDCNFDQKYLKKKLFN